MLQIIFARSVLYLPFISGSFLVCYCIFNVKERRSDTSNLVLADGRCLVLMSCINKCSLKTPFTSHGAELFPQVCKKQRPQKLGQGRSESVIPGTWKCPLVVYEVNSLTIMKMGIPCLSGSFNV